MKCEHTQIVTIVKTGSALDNTSVRVTGIAAAIPSPSGLEMTYIVERADGRFFQTTYGPWQSITITEHCLAK